MNLLEAPVDHDETNLRDELTAKWADKSKEEILKAKVDSDIYIKSIERQKDELRTDYLSQREELLAKAKFEDLLDRFEKSNNPPVAPTSANESHESQPIDIDSRVKLLMEQSKREERQTSNFNKVQEKLKERFGNNYASVLKDTGLPEKQINEIAMESPEAFFRLIGLDNNVKENFQAPPRSNQRNDHFSPRPMKKDWSYYQEMKKSNPKLYLDPKISVEMHNSAIEMGDAFYG